MDKNNGSKLNRGISTCENEDIGERVFRKEYTKNGQQYKLKVTVRWNDKCGNGHNDFSITGTQWEYMTYHLPHRWVDACGGCIHEIIAEQFPELEPYIKWHLCGSNGPMYYIANTVYLAGDRDCNGLLKGESRQIRNGRTGKLCWMLEHHPDIPNTVEADEAPPTVVVLKYVPWCRIGDGKERQLDAARGAAVWPEATDEQLMLPKEELTKLLEARLPSLMTEFRKDVESLGFTW